MALGLAEAGDIRAAIDLLRDSLSMAEGWPPIHFHLGDLLRRDGRADEAEAAFARYLVLDPEDCMGAGIKLSLMGRGVKAHAMTQNYVRSLFDQYAPRFDKALVEDLHYSTPNRLASAIFETYRGGVWGRALDLGCGTGLSMAPLRESVGYAEGIDLSPRMIDEARAKNLYDALHVCGIEEFLNRPLPPYDLILAADVFVYVGRLDDIFKGAARALGCNGALAFSVQNTSAEPYILGEDHRYAHGARYIEDCANAANLKKMYSESTILRHDAGSPVKGELYIFEKTG